MSGSATYWFQFFLDAGIPAPEAGRYAGSFSTNRIASNMIIDLTKEHLEQLGITVLGDCIAILKQAKKIYAKELKEKSIKKSAQINQQQQTINGNSSISPDKLLPETILAKNLDPVSVTIEADSVSDGTMKSIESTKTMTVKEELQDMSYSKVLSDDQTLDKTAFHKKPSNLEESHRQIANDTKCNKKLSNIDGSISRDELVEDKVINDDEEMESSGNEEMCYVEHKTVTVKPLQSTTSERTEHIKKTTTKRSIHSTSKGNENNSGKKSVFDRLGNDKPEGNKILNQLDVGSVFDRLGNKSSKKEKSTDCDSALIPLLCVHG